MNRIQLWRSLQVSELRTIERITNLAQIVKRQTGCTWGAAILAAEDCNKKGLSYIRVPTNSSELAENFTAEIRLDPDSSEKDSM